MATQEQIAKYLEMLKRNGDPAGNSLVPMAPSLGYQHMDEPLYEPPKPNYVEDWNRQPQSANVLPQTEPLPNNVAPKKTGQKKQEAKKPIVAEPESGGGISEELKGYVDQLGQKPPEPKGHDYSALGEILDKAGSSIAGVQANTAVYDRIARNKQQGIENERQSRMDTMATQAHVVGMAEKLSEIKSKRDQTDPDSQMSRLATQIAISSGFAPPGSRVTAAMFDMLKQGATFDEAQKQNAIQNAQRWRELSIEALKASQATRRMDITEMRLAAWNEANALRALEYKAKVASRELGNWEPKPGFLPNPKLVDSLAETDFYAGVVKDFIDGVVLPIYEQEGAEPLIGAFNRMSEVTKSETIHAIQKARGNGVMNEHELIDLNAMLSNPNGIRGIVDHAGTIAALKQVRANMDTLLNQRAESYGFQKRTSAPTAIQHPRTIIPNYSSPQQPGQGADLSPFINAQTPLVPSGTQGPAVSPTWDPASGTPPVYQGQQGQPQTPPQGGAVVPKKVITADDLMRMSGKKIIPGQGR